MILRYSTLMLVYALLISGKSALPFYLPLPTFSGAALGQVKVFPFNKYISNMNLFAIYSLTQSVFFFVCYRTIHFCTEQFLWNAKYFWPTLYLCSFSRNVIFSYWRILIALLDYITDCIYIFLLSVIFFFISFFLESFCL